MILTEELFEKMVDHEIQWLSYYSTSNSRLKLNSNSNLYDELEVMGYCKKPTPLYIRCSHCLLTNNSKIDKETTLDTLLVSNRIKGEFDYTPLEIYMIIYPDKRSNIINRLKPKEEKWECSLLPKNWRNHD